MSPAEHCVVLSDDGDTGRAVVALYGVTEDTTPTVDFLGQPTLFTVQQIASRHRQRRMMGKIYVVCAQSLIWRRAEHCQY